MRWVKRLLLLFTLPLVLAVAAAAVYMQRTLPVAEGTLRVAGLTGEVRVVRDQHGIPTIQATHDRDMFFALGFVHAQDRLWQLTTHQRIASGSLSEAFGPAALDSDRFIRALGVRRAAQAQWSRVQGEARTALEAYSAGINAYVQDHMRALPPEFLILGVRPQAWTPVDTLAWSIMMAWDLGGNWTTEMLRLRLSQRLSVEQIQELLPPYPGEKPLPVTDYAALYAGLRVHGQASAEAFDRLLAMAPPSGQQGVGSNNWVVAASHTTTGGPLLANDPHLSLTTPSLWYFARLISPGYRVAGATMPGLPMVILGQNAELAWGFTNTAPDVQDLYLEQIDPADASRYRTPEGWENFRVFDEVIRVKGQDEVRLSVRETRHGPVISDAGGAATRGIGNGRYVLAMQWTALRDDASVIEAGLRFNRASNVAEFVKAADAYQAPMQNIVVADRQGSIGFVAAGRVPIRHPDNDLLGQAPAPGWEARYDWQGFLEPQLTPREFDPQRGWIATANHRIHGADYPHYLTSEWTLPYRAQRIELLLSEKREHSFESLRAIQADVVSLAARKLLPVLQGAQPTHALGAQAMQLLETFDGTMAADKPEPLIFAAWARHLTRQIFADDIGEELYDSLEASRDFRAALERVLEEDITAWCNNQATDVTETCAQQIDSALDAALSELAALHGSDLARWRWGDAHEARSIHRPFSQVASLAPWFEVRTPTGGDTYTVNVGRYRARGDEPYVNRTAASMRAIYDLNEPANSGFMHATGQSGLVFSSHYKDFAQRWVEVGMVPVWPADPNAGLNLTLLPAR